jgi:hypothetical protein
VSLLSGSNNTIAQINPCIVLLGLYSGSGMHHSFDKHLACGGRMNLNCCKVTAITGDYDMTIITMDNLCYNRRTYALPGP